MIKEGSKKEILFGEKKLGEDYEKWLPRVLKINWEQNRCCRHKITENMYAWI